jgi:CheY-like chemotaxis protein
VLAGRKVLIVDDDVRNIFALTSALEAYNMEVVHAENGQEGIDLLKATPGIEAVLMDIMMPEMDGYEAISAIRDMDDFKTLPIIALTAKAMKADRDHCLEVGASDYISKPLDINQLLSLLRVWLYRQDETL